MSSVNYTLPPDTRSVGSGNPPADMNAVIDALTATGAGFNILNAAFSGGADPTGVADSTVAVNAALAAAAATSAPGGAAVYAPHGTYTVSNLLIDNNVVLKGDGPSNTVFVGKPGSSGYMIALKHPTTTQFTGLQDLMLKPNTGSLGGVLIDNTGFVYSSGPLIHRMSNVQVNNAGGDAYHVDNTGGVIADRLGAYDAGRYGVYIGGSGTDSRYVNCDIGPTGSNGWEILGNNNYLLGCTAFYNGWNGASFNTTSIGFHLNGCSYVCLTGCEAQNAALHGVEIGGAYHCAVTGCEMDSNSSGVSNGAGIHVASSTNCSVTGCIGGPTPTQAYGIITDGACNGTVIMGNPITGTVGQILENGSGYLYMDVTGIKHTGSLA